MVNIICLFVLEGSIAVPRIRWGMCAQRLCCHNSFSDGEWLVAAVRAPRHMPHTTPVQSMTRSHQYIVAEGLGATLCVLDCQVSYTPHQTPTYEATEHAVLSVNGYASVYLVK